MFVKFLPPLYERYGAVKFTVIYGALFSILVNTLSLGAIAFIFDDRFSLRRIAVYLAMHFLTGVFISQSVIKRIKSGEL